VGEGGRGGWEIVENEDVAVDVDVAVGLVSVFVVVGVVVVCCDGCDDDEDGSGLRFTDDEDDVIFVIRVILSVTRSLRLTTALVAVIAGLLIY
jgi:hypothetical protein